MVEEITTTKKLAEAVRYEEEAIRHVRGAKPSFHVTPPVGWMNDPNGFSCYNGEYHLFYQYHPYSTHWGPMHWGHYKTKDFIKWEQLPCALAPDTEYDGQGCFSGTALEHEGKHILMYTSVLEKKEPDGSRTVRQTQSIAVGDGVNYRKYEHNPVITADMLPAGSSLTDFRDPKIWREKDGFCALIGSMNEDGSGQLALFTSKDGLTWEFDRILDYCRNRYGKMWECPDFFQLDGAQVLIVSPQFMQAEGLEFHNGNNVAYFIGSYDKEKRLFDRGEAHSIDYGLDFYAPQTLRAEDGRRIMVGWLENWDNYMTPEDFSWSGMMTIPRELFLRDGRLYQLPVRELEQYYSRQTFYKKLVLSEADGSQKFQGVQGRSFDMTVELTGGDYSWFTIGVACGQGKRTDLTYDRARGIFTTDRTYSGMERDLLSCRSMSVDEPQEGLKIRILMDVYSVEVFINDGEKAMTSVIYTPLTAEEILFSCRGKAECAIGFHTVSVD